MSTLPDMLERQVAAGPDAAALSCGDGVLTFSALNARANSLARELIAAGVGPEELVALFLPRSLDVIVGLLGILKAGGAYVPIDPTYPAERVAFMLQDARPKAVVVAAGLLARLPRSTCNVVNIQPASGRALYGEANVTDAERVVPLTAQNPAYAIYTSGSTGKPKAVVVPHGAVVSLCHGLDERIYESESKRRLRVALNGSLSFDTSVKQVVQLLQGHMLDVVPDDIRLDGPALRAYVERRQIEVMDCVPSQAQILLNAGLLDRQVAGLRALLIGGDAIGQTLWERLHQATALRPFNMYGPAECTVDATVCDIRAAGATPSIGTALAHVEVLVLDERLQPASPLQEGELYISGGGVARGYLRQPGLTSSRFVANPHGAVGTTMYRTGDRAKWSRDGRIEFLGRLDHQLKVRGVRIEPAEVESVLLQLPGVHGAVVVGRGSSAGGHELIAMIVWDAGDAMSGAEVRTALAERLPPALLPAHVLIVDAIPVNPSGKVDRAASLGCAQAILTSGRGAAAATLSPIEESIASVWTRVLNSGPIGLDDDFFRVGGDSLHAMSLLDGLRDTLNIDVPLRSLFENPTVRGLAAAVALFPDKTRPSRHAIAVLPRAGSMPMSSSQVRIWLIHQLDPSRRAYAFQATLHFHGRLDRWHLAAALGEIVARHEIYRTSFATTTSGGVVAHVNGQLEPFPLTLVDLTHLDGSDRMARAMERVAAEVAQPFDPGRLPLIRWILFRIDVHLHVLLHVSHHLVHDGWSFNRFLEELMEGYQARVRGVPPSLPALTIQFADFAARERSWLESPDALAEIDYWKSQLLDAPPPLALQADRERQASFDFRGGAVRWRLKAGLFEQLQLLARREAVSGYAVLLTAFIALLRRYGSPTDLCVGVGAANRGRPGTHALIGMFVNTLALRIKVPPDGTAQDWLQCVWRAVRDAHTRQECPLDEVVKAISPERAPGQNPLFSVMFNIHHAPLANVAIPDLSVELHEGINNGSAKFDLNVIVIPPLPAGGTIVRENDPCATVNWEFSAALFDQWRIEQMAGHYERILEAIVADPTRVVNQIEFLSAAERRTLLVEWNATHRAVPDGSLASLFERQRDQRPDAVALVFGSSALTYAELDARANQMARRLVAAGACEESIVAFCLGRSLDLVIAMLAIVKTGAAYLPLDTRSPAARLEEMVRETAPCCVLTTLSSVARFSAHAATVAIDDDETAEVVAGLSRERRVCEAARTDDMAAYVMYTSGSTGAPKGVVVTTGGIKRLVCDPTYVVLGPDQVMAQLAPVAFDAATFEIWGSLLNGGRLVLAADESPSLEFIGRLLLMHAVTTCWLTSGLLHAMVQARLADLSGLTQLLAGGDALEPAVVQAVVEAYPALRLVNGYGPTEGTTFTCCHHIRPDDEWAGTVPIGTPIGQTQVYVLDPRLEPVPVGVRGELYIAGSGLARGYLNRAAATAGSFVANPNGSVGLRMYRTGDYARWRRNGTLEFLGRVDSQVKISGFRIELAEVEAALRNDRRVKEAVVVARGTGDRRALVAFVSRVDGSGGDEFGAEIRRALRHRLPDYMIPSDVACIEQWPLTPNGKVDRGALSEVAFRRTVVVPNVLTPEEEVLCGLFADVLEVNGVGPDEDFFGLGGHSLLATSLVSRVRASLQTELALRTIFEAPTPRLLAQRLQATALRHAPVTASIRHAMQPVSSAQRRLWFLGRFDSASAAYNVLTAVRLHGQLDVAALGAAVQAIVDRHESLRTHFAETDGEPVQVIEAARLIPVAVEPLPDATAATRRNRLAAILRDEANAPFDLSRGPLVRIRLVRMGPDDHVLVRVSHHIVTDGWSEGIFNRELLALYDAFRTGQPNPLPSLAIQYADYALWQRRLVESSALKAGLAFWVGQLAGLPEWLPLPTDRVRPAVQAFAASVHEQVVSVDCLAALKRISRAHGATLYMTMLAAYAILLSRHSGRDDIVIGSPIAGREDIQLEDLIGCFVNTLALRVRVDPRQSVASLIAAVRETTLDAYRNQDVPFEHVVEALVPGRSLSMTPLCQVTFTLQNAPFAPLELSGLRVEPVKRVEHRVRTDLELHAIEDAGSLSVRWLFNDSLFDAWRIERMADHFGRILDAIARQDTQPVGDVEILSEADRVQLLAVAPVTGPDDICDTVPALFEDQVVLAPDAVAVCAGNQHLTFSVLNARANAVAHRLLAAGIGPESIVALAVERSLLMLIALVGVTKAGAAFLPLDSEAPTARLAFLLEDAAPSAVLTAGSAADVIMPIASGLGIGLIDVASLPDGKNLANPTDAERPATLSPEHSAYVIYTSGSTGLPKGVIVSHHSVTRLFAVTQPAFQFGRSDVWALFHSYAFDFSVWEIWGALLHGGRLVVVPYLTTRAPSELAGLLRREQVTVLNQTPSAFYQLEQADRDDPGLLCRHALRVVICGGEILDFDHVADWYKRHTSQAPVLVNMYGITETTVHVTSISLEESAIETAGRSVIGRALPGMCTYVLDQQLRLSPVGVAGELYVSGAGVARGYLKRSPLTAQRFVADPFGSAGSRMYRTGDLARWRADGNLECLGRSDRQIKLRGFRIELGEIESILRRDPGVQDVLVVVSGANDLARLVAYVIGRGDAETRLCSRLLEDLRLTLPDYMVPSAIMLLDKWPLTPNGKLDRDALPPPSLGEAGATVAMTPVEEILCGLFADVLGVKNVGVQEDFFSLGGHSLMAMRLVSRIRAALGVELSIRLLFEAPNVRALSGRLSATTVEKLALAPQVRPPKIPLSYAQQRLWLLHQLGGATEYHMPVALRMRGTLNVTALREAVQGIVDRHETLRTLFVEADGDTRQVIEPSATVSLGVEDLRELDPSDQVTRLQEALHGEWTRPFDLCRGPLLRTRLLRLADEEHVLLRTVHHIVSDGWSEAVFNQELLILYEAARTGGTAALPQLPVHYADFAICQRAMVDAGGLQKALDYWSQQLSGLPRLELPTDRPRPALLSAQAAKHYHSVSAPRLAALERVSRAHQTTLHMTLLAAFSLLLSRYTGQRDIAFGVGAANRQDEQLEGLIGFFVNTLVVRIRVRPEMTIDELLGQVRRTAIEAFEHQDVPFDRVVEALAPERSANSVPLVQVVFAMQNAPRVLPMLGDLQIDRVVDNAPLTRFDLEVDVFPRDGELTVCWMYNCTLFDRWRIEQMANHFDVMLDSVVLECDVALLSQPGAAAREPVRNSVCGA